MNFGVCRSRGILIDIKGNVPSCLVLDPLLAIGPIMYSAAGWRTPRRLGKILRRIFRRDRKQSVEFNRKPVEFVTNEPQTDFQNDLSVAFALILRDTVEFGRVR